MTTDAVCLQYPCASVGVCTHVQRLRVPDTLQTLSAGRHVGVRAVVVRLVRLVRLVRKVRFVRTDTMTHTPAGAFMPSVLCSTAHMLSVYTYASAMTDDTPGTRARR